MRYLVALTPPATRRPDTACLALDDMTVRLTTCSMHLVASSLEPAITSRTILPADFHVNNSIYILDEFRYNEHQCAPQELYIIHVLVIACNYIGWNWNIPSANIMHQLRFVPELVSTSSPNFFPILRLTSGGSKLTREQVADRPQSCFQSEGVRV